MGLFSSVLHLKTVEQQEVIDGLNVVLKEFGYDQKQVRLLTHENLEDTLSMNDSIYFVSPRCGDWVTVIEATHGPWLFDLTKAISNRLNTFAIALHLHDGDVFTYQFLNQGKVLDEFNSNPQYFEVERLPDQTIESLRHNPLTLSPCLPENVTVGEVAKLLNKGWWDAYGHKKLDKHGVQIDDDDFVDEDQRMTEFGELLQFFGKEGNYPFTKWRYANGILWGEFYATFYFNK